MSVKTFARVRPYLDKNALAACIKGEASGPESRDFFLSSGRAALKWLLMNLRAIHGEPLRVGVQAFTCPVVAAAIAESGNRAVWLDISPDVLTTTIELVNFEAIDVLVLTHLFGIPNPDYVAICEAADDAGIAVIDDCALTVGAEMEGVPVGLLSDAAFYSFGFDKPISCFLGGALRVNDPDLRERMAEEYESLPFEPREKEIRDLRKLGLYHYLTHPERYRMGLSFDGTAGETWAEHAGRGRMADLALKFAAQPMAGKVDGRLRGIMKKEAGIAVQRLSVKPAYLAALFSRYAAVAAHRAEAVALAVERIGRAFPKAVFPGRDLDPVSHRLAVLLPEDERAAFIAWGREHRVEVGVFNWPRLAFEGAKGAPEAAQFPNALAVSRRIVNCPVWSPEIWEF